MKTSQTKGAHSSPSRPLRVVLVECKWKFKGSYIVYNILKESNISLCQTLTLIKENYSNTNDYVGYEFHPAWTLRIIGNRQQ